VRLASLTTKRAPPGSAVRRNAPSRGDASLRGPLRQGWRLLGCSNTVVDQRWQLALAGLGAQCGGTEATHCSLKQAPNFILLQGLQAPLDTAATYGSAKMKFLVLGYLPVFQKRIKKYIVGQLIVVAGGYIQCGAIVVKDFAGRKIKFPRSKLSGQQPFTPSGQVNNVYWSTLELDLEVATLISSIDFVDIITHSYDYGRRSWNYQVTVCGRGTEEVVKTHTTDQSNFTLNY
jgi:hypothetical protein